MKKFTFLTAVAAIGLLGLSARAATVTNADVVKVALTVLVQTNTTVTSSATVFHVTKIKLVTKDVLNEISNQFNTTFPAGAQLATTSLFNGQIEVIDKNGNVILADAGTTTNLDSYEILIDASGNDVFTGKETDSKETFVATAVTTITFDNAADTAGFTLNGLSLDKVTFATKDSESFKFTGSGNGFLPIGDAVVYGTIYGSGKNNDEIEF